MKYSIVIPTKNRVGLCQRLIDSIDKAIIFSKIKPSFFELIVVDDSGIKHKYFSKILIPKILVNKDKHNAAYSRNRGGRIAQGDYIIFIDDDVVVRNLFFKKVEEINKKYNPDIFGGAIAPIKKESIKKDIPSIFFTYLLSFCSHGNYLTGSNLIMKKEVFLKNKFNESNEIAPVEDFYFFLQLKRKQNYKILHVCEIFILHENITWLDLFKKVIEYAKGHKRIYKKIKKIVFDINYEVISIRKEYSIRRRYKELNFLYKSLLLIPLAITSVILLIINIGSFLKYIIHSKDFYQKIFIRKEN